MRLLLLAVAALVSSPGSAQTDSLATPRSAGTGWSLSASQSADALRDGRSAWLTTRATAQRRFREGAVAVELGRAERFDQAAGYAVADVYHRLWPGSYGNLRVLAAPGAVTTAQSDVSAEVYQAVGRAELSGGLRRLDFGSNDAWLATASAGAYAGSWLLRARGTAAVSDGRAGLSVSGSARLLGETRHGSTSRLELSGGQGQEVVPEADGTRSTLRRSWFGLVRGEQPIGGPLAVQVGLGYTGDGDLSRWSGEAGVVARW